MARPAAWAQAPGIAGIRFAGADGIEEWDGLRLMALFRDRLLDRLVERRAISRGRVDEFVASRP